MLHVPHGVAGQRSERARGCTKSKPSIGGHGIDAAMAGEQTRAAIAAQPEWLAQVPTDRRFPDARLAASPAAGPRSTRRRPAATRCRRSSSSCGRSATPTCSSSSSHEGDTALTLEAAQAWDGPRWLITGKADSPLGELCEEVVVATPAIEESWCHTASYTCAVAAIAALPRGGRLLAAGRGRRGARASASRCRATSAS